MHTTNLNTKAAPPLVKNPESLRSDSHFGLRWRHPGAFWTANCERRRGHNSAVTAPASELYRVFVVPDFWFNMQDVVLSGGPKNPGQDFLPFYYGTAETGLFRPSAELLVDGQPVGVGSPLDENVQQVNFGTVDKLRWA